MRTLGWGRENEGLSTLFSPSVSPYGEPPPSSEGGLGAVQQLAKSQFIILRKKAAARVSGGLVLLNLLNYSRVEKCLMVRTI